MVLWSHMWTSRGWVLFRKGHSIKVTMVKLEESAVSLSVQLTLLQTSHGRGKIVAKKIVMQIEPLKALQELR